MEGKNCVYLLFSEKINKFYIGKTTDINRRFIEHTLGEEKYTRAGRPWRLLSIIKCATESGMTKLENKLKKSKNKTYTKWFFEKYGVKIDNSAGR